MSSSSSSLTTSFLGAVQASISVLLTIWYGVLAGQYGLISDSSAKDISKACVRMFLPALLFTNVGSELNASTLPRFVPVLLWSILYNTVSVGIGTLATKLLKMPNWATPAIAFNNTTAFPLLLVQAFASTDILSSLLMGQSDTQSEALKRAKSYFLVNSIVGNSLTFALGPRLLANGQEEDAPEDKQKDDETASDDSENGESDDVEQGEQNEGDGHATEQTSLLPSGVVKHGRRAARHGYRHGYAYWSKLPSWAQEVLDFIYQFFNAPLIGAALGIAVGLIPPLHRAFFAKTESGGVLNAWLTTSLSNIGDLFAAGQVIVVGVKLGTSLRRMKAGEPSGTVPWRPMVIVTVIRFLLWPIVSIALIWLLASKTNLLSRDPILWFVMMLMPTGPPALKLTALADVNGSDEIEKMVISKFLTMSYALSPLMCFTVVAALKAAEMINGGSK